MEQTRKVVINQQYGGFHPPYAVLIEWARRKNYAVVMSPSGKRIYPWVVTHLPYSEPFPEYADLFDIPGLAVPEGHEPTGELVSTMDIPRDDKDFVAIVEELRATGDHWASTIVKVVEIPADVRWMIKSYDGKEHIAEVHRTWC